MSEIVRVESDVRPRRKKKKGVKSKRKRKLDISVDVHRDQMDIDLKTGGTKATLQVEGGIALLFHLFGARK